ncbi:hypothetical protein JTB14_008898 [Gonioctena quinquepunctata]|nr:hypothetical protein JTB14_008898 [Gonioctena quinquepunctata]
MDDDNLETDVQKATNQVNENEKPSDVPRQKTFEQRFYKNTDIGPFLVIIEAKEETVQILDAKRLNRRVVKEDKTVEYVTTSTLLVTFEGVILPRYVTMSYLSMPVIPYIQPVMQCFYCFEFGHTKLQCRSTNSNKCHNCSTAHESEVICTKKCEFCHSIEHNSLYKKCPEYERQKEIKRIMAYENISYFDAKELVPKMYDAGIDEARIQIKL